MLSLSLLGSPVPTMEATGLPREQQSNELEEQALQSLAGADLPHPPALLPTRNSGSVLYVSASQGLFVTAASLYPDQYHPEKGTGS